MVFGNPGVNGLTVVLLATTELKFVTEPVRVPSLVEILVQVLQMK